MQQSSKERDVVVDRKIQTEFATEVGFVLGHKKWTNFKLLGEGKW